MQEVIFKDKNIWIFDLDNTVYSPKTKIFEQIDLRMKSFISQKLCISKTEAYALQKIFYKKYGTTLYGLMKHYGFEPDEFLRYVHDIDLSSLKKSHSLFSKINALPGKKIIYTNGEYNYAKKVLKSLGIESLFEEILDIKRCNFIPKPSIEPLISYLKKKKLQPVKAVYFEDLEKNLENAHKYGITTIHIAESVAENKGKKKFVDFKFKNILDALESISKFT
ncbi:MAG: pyrimidine 5'-nucleotidase [Alphaproteobacteria bacterium]